LIDTDMSLPDFNAEGDLPPAVYRATIEEVIARFGSETKQRQQVATRLSRVWELAIRTGHLERLVVFGSFVTAKPAPNDVDVILVMNDGFCMEQCNDESALVFDHVRAQNALGASIFWIRPGLLINDTLEAFIQRWQRKREGGQRGIVEVTND
jgi:hypothetical protein